MTDTTEYQSKHNGPLIQETIDFLNQVRTDRNWSYKTLGEHLGVSGAFAHAILNGPSNITTNTAMQKIAAGIARLQNNDLSGAKTSDAPRVDGLMEHPFALRPDLTLKLALPADLTEREAERLGYFIRSLVQ